MTQISLLPLPGTNEGNLRLRDAGQAAGKLADDFVGELVRVFANLQVCWAAAINYADDRLRRRIANVEQPSLNGDFGRRLGQIAEADVIGVGGLRDPSGSFQFRWDGRHFRRIEARAGEIEDAAELQVVADDLGEERGVRFCGVGAGREVGDGQARLGLAKASARAEPVLARSATAGQQNDSSEEEQSCTSCCGFQQVSPLSTENPALRARAATASTKDRSQK